MRIHPLPAFTDNYIWLLIQEQQAIFDCIDPGDAHPVLDFAAANKLQLRSILLTHHHSDHIAGVEQLLNIVPNCPVYAPTDPRIPQASQRVCAREHILIPPYRFQILSNPGHTATHISYYEETEAWLFCGDTLFSAGCGRVFDGTLEQLHQSLQRFKQLPAETKIFCAHEYTLQNLRFAASVEPKNRDIQEYIKQLPRPCTLPSTIERELLINPFFRTDQAEVQEYAIKHGAVNTDSLSVFRVLREQKNRAS